MKSVIVFILLLVIRYLYLSEDSLIDFINPVNFLILLGIIGYLIN